MRSSPLAVLLAGVLMAACSKPEPAGGAPAPTAITIDSAKTPADATKPMADSMKVPSDSTKATADSMKATVDSTKSTAVPVPDSAAKP